MTFYKEIYENKSHNKSNDIYYFTQDVEASIATERHRQDVAWVVETAKCITLATWEQSLILYLMQEAHFREATDAQSKRQLNLMFQLGLGSLAYLESDIPCLDVVGILTLGIFHAQGPNRKT
ncbi:hypothetical protein ACJX0J_030990 [Zea mays]